MCLKLDSECETSHMPLEFAFQRGLPYFGRDRHLLKAVHHHHRVEDLSLSRAIDKRQAVVVAPVVRLPRLPARSGIL